MPFTVLKVANIGEIWTKWPETPAASMAGAVEALALYVI